MDGPAEAHWGAEAVDPRGFNLPALKARFVLDHVPLSGSVVEIGCGEGKVLRTLARHRPGLDLHGTDVREPRGTPDGYRFHRATDRLPFEDHSMDGVLVVDVLEHVPDPRALLADAARVLKHGGKLVACVPVEGEPFSFYEAYRRALGKDTFVVTKEHVQAFTHKGLRELIEEHFTIMSLEYAYHALGHLMDASFFAAARLPFVRDFWWNDNTYYNPEQRRRSAVSTALNSLLELGNAAAWLESTLFKRSRATSACILVDASVR
jgi:SAM-dependent methyltransferase